jgi:nudix-type nucleoside diphosphatase (YffH/AdpP family)
MGVLQAAFGSIESVRKESDMRARIVESQSIRDGRVKLWRVRMAFADGDETWREVAYHGDSIAVLPYDAERRVALTVSLARAPALFRGLDGPGEEACAGMIDEGETPQQTTCREAMEEMGLRLDSLEPIGCTWPSPGVSAEQAFLFLAPYGPAARIAAGGGAPGEHEHITVNEPALADLAAKADAGAIGDLCLLALVQSLRLKRPELF